MASLRYFLLFITQWILSESMNTDWIYYTLSSGIYCSKPNNMCARLAHVVFWVEPTDPLMDITGGGYIRFDDNDWQPAGSIDFEQHCWSFNDSLRVQAYNFMHESFFELDRIDDFNFSTVDIKLFLRNPAGKEKKTQYLQLPQPMAAKGVVLDIPSNSERMSFYDHGNSTIECSRKRGECRLMAHVVWKYAPKGDLITNYNYIGGGELWFNNDTKNLAPEHGM